MGEQIKEKLNIFVKNNFGSSGLQFIQKKLKEEDILDLDLADDFIQKRFVNEVVNDLFRKLLSEDKVRDFKLLLFSQLFGRKEAMEHVFQEKYLKGTPPIKFLQHFFGTELGKEIIAIIQEKHKVSNIKKKDDTTQIAFVKDAIESVFASQEDLKKDLNFHFFRYLKSGENQGPTLQMVLELQNQDDNEDTIRNVEAILDKAEKASAHEVFRDMLEKMSVADEKKKALIGTLHRLKEGGGEGKGRSHGDLDKELINRIKRFMSEEEATKLIEQGKAYAGISSLETAKRDTKAVFADYLVNNTIISSYSPQKSSMVQSWIKMILGI